MSFGTPNTPWTRSWLLPPSRDLERGIYNKSIHAHKSWKSTWEYEHLCFAPNCPAIGHKRSKQIPHQYWCIYCSCGEWIKAALQSQWDFPYWFKHYPEKFVCKGSNFCLGRSVYSTPVWPCFVSKHRLLMRLLIGPMSCQFIRLTLSGLTYPTNTTV